MSKIETDRYTLYLGDIRDIRHNEKPKICVTDPPYKLTSGGVSPADGRRMGGCFNNEKYNNNGNIVQCDIDWKHFMPIIHDTLQSQAHAYVMANNRHIANCENAALMAGFKLHNWLVWDKRTATPNRWYMKNLEFIGMFYKGPAYYITDMSAKQLISFQQIDSTGHPTEKPVPLMQHYIEQSSKKDELIFDPFMGSGTTGVAAIRAGRRFVGYEIDPKWFDVAAKRLASASRVETLL